MADGQIYSSPDVCKYRNNKPLDVVVLMYKGKDLIFVELKGHIWMV